MAEPHKVTLAVTGAGGTRMSRFVLDALVNDERGFVGLPQTDHYTYTGSDSPAHRERIGC